jgi:hypothetical protein
MIDELVDPTETGTESTSDVEIPEVPELTESTSDADEPEVQPDEQRGEEPPKAGEEESEAYKSLLKKYGGDKNKMAEQQWRLMKQNAAMDRKLRERDAREEPPEQPPDEPQEPDYNAHAHLADIDEQLKERSEYLKAAPQRIQGILDALSKADSVASHCALSLAELDEDLKGATDEFEREKIEKKRSALFMKSNEAQLKLQTLGLQYTQARQFADQVALDIKRMNTERARVVRSLKEEERNQEREREADQERQVRFVGRVQRSFNESFAKLGITDKTPEGAKILDGAWPIVRDQLAAARLRNDQLDLDRIDVKRFVESRVKSLMDGLRTTPPKTSATPPTTPQRTPQGTAPKTADTPRPLSPQEEYDAWKSQKRAAWRTGGR